MPDLVRNVTVFGATGNLGAATIRALTATGKHKVRAVTREGSLCQTPLGVDVFHGDLSSTEFLARCVGGQDAVVIALGMTADASIDEQIVTAAANAGVKYILPNEFVSQDSLRATFPFGIHERKNKIRRTVEALGKSSWIAIVNGLWYDYSMIHGGYGIDVSSRRATIWSPGDVKANATTVAKVGKCIAALLGLPPDQLQQHRNQCVYVSSFHASHMDILRSVQRVTNTTDDDWEIKIEDAVEAVREGQEKAANGDLAGFLKVVHATQFVVDGGGDYEASHGLVNEELQLEEESLDEVNRALVHKLASNR